MIGDPTTLATAQESLRVARTSGSPTAIAYCLFTLALVVAPEDPTRALALVDESRRCAEQAANTYAILAMSGVRCLLLSQSGDHHTAASAFLEVAREAAKAGRREHQAMFLSGFAGSLAAHGNLEPAAIVFGWAESVLGPMTPHCTSTSATMLATLSPASQEKSDRTATRGSSVKAQR